MSMIPRCRECGSKLVLHDGHYYCPDCTSFTLPDEAAPRHRSPSQQAKNDPEGFEGQMDSQSGPDDVR